MPDIQPHILAQAKAAAEQLQPNAQADGGVYLSPADVAAMDKKYKHALDHGNIEDALKNAVVENRLQDAAYLLDKWADPNGRYTQQYADDSPEAQSARATNPVPRTSLIALAVENDNAEMIELLHKNRANVNAIGPDGSTAFIDAVRENHGKAIAQLMEYNELDITHRDKSGHNALDYAVLNGDMDTVSRILHSPDGRRLINAMPMTQDGQTPLAEATAWMPTEKSPLKDEKKSLAMVRLLLEEGADPDKAVQIGLRPLMLASLDAKEDIVDALLAKNADPNKTSERGPADRGDKFPNGVNALMAVASSNDDTDSKLRIADKFLSFPDADVNAKDETGKTALMYAAEADNIEMVELLLYKGARLDDRDKTGKTALDYAQDTLNSQRKGNSENPSEAAEYGSTARYLQDVEAGRAVPGYNVPPKPPDDSDPQAKLQHHGIKESLPGFEVSQVDREHDLQAPGPSLTAAPPQQQMQRG